MGVWFWCALAPEGWYVLQNENPFSSHWFEYNRVQLFLKKKQADQCCLQKMSDLNFKLHFRILAPLSNMEVHQHTSDTSVIAGNGIHLFASVWTSKSLTFHKKLNFNIFQIEGIQVYDLGVSWTQRILSTMCTNGNDRIACEQIILITKRNTKLLMSNKTFGNFNVGDRSQPFQKIEIAFGQTISAFHFLSIQLSGPVNTVIQVNNIRVLFPTNNFQNVCLLIHLHSSLKYFHFHMLFLKERNTMISAGATHAVHMSVLKSNMNPVPLQSYCV